MIEVDTVTRRWGNSIGISLPRDIVERANLKPDKDIKIFISEKKVDLKKIFGTLSIKKPTQVILDEIKSEKNVFEAKLVKL